MSCSSCQRACNCRKTTARTSAGGGNLAFSGGFGEDSDTPLFYTNAGPEDTGHTATQPFYVPSAFTKASLNVLGDFGGEGGSVEFGVWRYAGGTGSGVQVGTLTFTEAGLQTVTLTTALAAGDTVAFSSSSTGITESPYFTATVY